jgi:hypothetical protein
MTNLIELKMFPLVIAKRQVLLMIEAAAASVGLHL